MTDGEAIFSFFDYTVKTTKTTAFLSFKVAGIYAYRELLYWCVTSGEPFLVTNGLNHSLEISWFFNSL